MQAFTIRFIGILVRFWCGFVITIKVVGCPMWEQPTAFSINRLSTRQTGRCGNNALFVYYFFIYSNSAAASSACALSMINERFSFPVHQTLFNEQGRTPKIVIPSARHLPSELSSPQCVPAGTAAHKAASWQCSSASWGYRLRLPGWS